MKYIKSPQNQIVKSLAALKNPQGRKEQQVFLAEGENMVKEAMQENAAVTLLIDDQKLEQYKFYTADFAETLVFSKSAFNKISSAKTPQGIACVCRIPAKISFKALGTRIVLLNGVQDAGNLGTIWRTAEAAGFTGLIADKKTADLYSPKVISASKGACFRIPAKREADLNPLFKQLSGCATVAASLDGVPLNSANIPKDNIILIIGSEGHGIDKEVLEKSTHRVRIPMRGKVESLNAAIAAALMMYSITGEI